MRAHIYILILLSFLFNTRLVNAQQNSFTDNFYLIAHRGGVVDSITPENSKESIIKAAKHGFWMIEVDIRATKDKVLITNHDKDFNRYFGVDKKVIDMTWKEISELKSENGTYVQKLEDVFKLCSELGLNVMIDNKITGFDIDICNHLIYLLDKYNLRENALMIGTTATTDFFTGKIKISCNKEQLKNNMNRNDYSPNNYYYFGNPTKEDAIWAHQNNIMIVGVINSWAIPNEKEEIIVNEIINNLRDSQVNYIQLDSKYVSFLYNN